MLIASRFFVTARMRYMSVVPLSQNGA